MTQHCTFNPDRSSPDVAASASPLTLVIDKVRTSGPDHFGCLNGWQWDTLRAKLLKAGFSPDAVTIHLLSDLEAGRRTLDPGAFIVGLGEATLRHFTDKKSIDKWVLSPLKTKDGQDFIPAYDFGRMQKQYELNLYLDLVLRRSFEMVSTLSRGLQTAENFLLNPGLEETLCVLKSLTDKPEIACDVETGYGQINTVGFAWSPTDAIAINVLPDNFSDHSYFRLWSAIRDVLETPGRKIFQNFIYDVSYFSAYGIRVRGDIWDTMWAMKVLWPELKSNLGNVGRIYTRRPYWKDDGKVTDEEGAKKSWGDIRDWPRHYRYNASDTTGTFEAAGRQRSDLDGRGLLAFFTGYVMRLADPIREMCANGIPLDLEQRARLRAETEERLASLLISFQEKVGSPLNPNSPKQLLTYLKSQGVALPKKFDRATGLYKESTDSASIKKIRLKKDVPGLAELQDLKALGKALSSYLSFEVRADGCLSYSLNGCGTESLRWSGNKDAWDRGVNIQTIPREGGDVSIKSMFVAPAGFSFIEVDLRQAESRFVAYDSADKTLIDMLESGADVHSHVGNAILRQMGKDPSLIPRDEFKSTWRQLGKKAGHGLNYGMKAGVFVETVFNELDIVISKKDAELITQAYMGLFPGIPRWHAWIKNELYTKRKLTAPTGWERYFYSRHEDALKEALAWRPQTTIPFITNQLMLYLIEQRKQGSLKFRLHYQCHDSLVMSAPEGEAESLMRACHRLDEWHPEIVLSGGRMVIPIESKWGKCMADLKEFTP